MKKILLILLIVGLIIAERTWAQSVGTITTDAQCQTAQVVEVGNVDVNDTLNGYTQVLQVASNDLNQKSQTIQALTVAASEDQVQIATANLAIAALSNCVVNGN
jgi:hypothetical protein